MNTTTKKPEQTLTHINSQGSANMVDVSNKVNSKRVARASGKIYMKTDTLAKIQNNNLKKGEVLAIARIAGIMAAKKASELIPLCHPIMLSKVDVDFEIVNTISKTNQLAHINCIASATTIGNTGVEMEALTAVNVALLTIYDMAKAIDRFMQISEISLLEKIGGKSGHWVNPQNK